MNKQKYALFPRGSFLIHSVKTIRVNYTWKSSSQCMWAKHEYCIFLKVISIQRNSKVKYKLARLRTGPALKKSIEKAQSFGGALLYSIQEKMFFEGIAIYIKFMRIMFSRREWMSFGFNEILKVSNIICQILMNEYAK